ncbi:glycoside hydrolase family 5 protein [Aquisalinus flavus]|uniref:Mannan endo-1,4-beta-mannosidase n=1 Tax=Aquisalinus flavus TaxID=1526572 RepID=A0A8J2V459_9PROT|nr:glycoside hydrolase family 5 protein [Aquisalinus flavus]MBD0427658.1 cellulase family glycosylhydrolase [Aquisalinus flavus]UNE47443.1 glycoside hydrolase family 5 protein [Aquisalinus flavus]GGD02794.1 mannan endo-1,4-beta-mannosidase [Aquisalinus flavus]
MTPNPFPLFIPLAALMAGVSACSSLSSGNGPVPQKGFSVAGDRLLDATDTPFVMRGINHPHAWQRQRTAKALPEIAATGANIVRVSLSSGAPWGETPKEEVAEIIRLAKAHDMIVMFTVHNTTGYGQQDWAIHLAETIPYWMSLADILIGQEAYVLINPGNEPTGNSIAPAVYTEMQMTTIKALRAAGFTHTMVIDGHDWGQDARQTMLTEAPALAAADPLANTIFSVHMYQVYAEAESIARYFAAFDAMDLPLIVGEFGPDHQGEPVDEETIFRLTNEMDIGYIGWSWSGNSAIVEDLDITVDFDPDTLSPWGDQLINGPGGIGETSCPAAVFREEISRPRFHKLRLRG